MNTLCTPPTHWAVLINEPQHHYIVTMCAVLIRKCTSSSAAAQNCCVGGHYQLAGLWLALAELFVESAYYKTLSCRKVGEVCECFLII